MNTYTLSDNPSCILINENCFEVLDEVESLNKGEKIVVVTDPPFNVGYHYDEYSDRMDDTEYVKNMCGIFRRFPCVIIHYLEGMYKFEIESKEARQPTP